jgi:hypothetical protein
MTRPFLSHISLLLRGATPSMDVAMNNEFFTFPWKNDQLDNLAMPNYSNFLNIFI